MRNYVITLFALLFVTSTTYAQTINPDSLLNSSPPTVENSPEADSSENQSTNESTTDQPKETEEKLWDNEGWVPHNRALTCHNMGNVRDYLTSLGQAIILSGFKHPSYIPNDPFDGMIVTRNPLTGEYTILLVQTDTGLACIVQMGTALRTAP